MKQYANLLFVIQYSSGYHHFHRFDDKKHALFIKLSQNLLRNKSIVMAGKGYYERSVCNATILWIQLWPLPGPLAEYS